MAAESSVPSLSQIRSWDTDHLLDAVTAWRTTADRWEEAFSQVASHMPAPGGVPWQGTAGNAALSRAIADGQQVGVAKGRRVE